MSKELFMEAHEEVIIEYLEKHPNATDDEAYEATGDLAYERMVDKYADMADYARDRAKDIFLENSKD